MADGMATGEIFIPEYAARVMQVMRSAGEEIYIVGGCVRDALLGLVPNDYDMTTSATPDQTLKILTQNGFRTIETGLRHGTVTAISEGKPIEITTFRIDGDYKDSRHPESVNFTRSLENDLARRDFTVNALAYSPESGVADLYGGREDLQNKIIRAVGDAERRFDEDALRIMRAFRFSAQLGFEIEADTLRAAEAKREGLKNISAERTASELLRLVCSKASEHSLVLMSESGVLDIITQNVLVTDRDRRAALFCALTQTPENDAARMGLLLTLTDAVGAKALLKQLKCSNKLTHSALAVREGAFCKIEAPRDAAHLAARIGREDALYAAYASVMLGNSPQEAVEFVKNNNSPTSISELAVGGDDLKALGLCGRDIGKSLASLLTLVLDGECKNEREELLATVKREKNKE